jgi:hypothetical protein
MMKKLFHNKLIYESPHVQNLLNDLDKVYKPTKPMTTLTTILFKKHIQILLSCESTMSIFNNSKDKSTFQPTFIVKYECQHFKLMLI